MNKFSSAISIILETEVLKSTQIEEGLGIERRASGDYAMLLQVWPSK